MCVCGGGFLNTGSDDWVRATARPGKAAWGRVWAGEVERPLVMKLGLELGQVTRCITSRALLIAPLSCLPSSDQDQEVLLPWPQKHEHSGSHRVHWRHAIRGITHSFAARHMTNNVPRGIIHNNFQPEISKLPQRQNGSRNGGIFISKVEYPLSFLGPP